MNMITLINVFTVEPANQQRLVDLLVRVTDEFVRQSPGFISSTLHRSFDGSKVTMYAQWKSVEEYEAMRRDPRPLPFFEEPLTLAKFDPGMYEVVRTFSPIGSRKGDTLRTGRLLRSSDLATRQLRRQDDFGETKPVRERSKLLGDRVHGVRGRVRLEMHRMDEQSSRLAVGFQVEPSHESVAEQEGKDVVAVLALVGRGVNLDPVVEIEEPQRAGTLPDERIERREKRPREDAARPASVAVKIGEASPAGNLDRLENARPDQRLDRQSGVVWTETEIVAQVLCRGDAERLGRALDEGALGILLVRSRQGEALGRNHALRKVVDPLETAAPRRRRDMTCPGQPFERPFGVAPFPPARPAAFFLEVRGRARTLVANAIE